MQRKITGMTRIPFACSVNAVLSVAFESRWTTTTLGSIFSVLTLDTLETWIIRTRSPRSALYSVSNETSRARSALSTFRSVPTLNARKARIFLTGVSRRTTYTVSYVTRGTRTAYSTVHCVSALYSGKAGPLGASFSRLAVVPVAYVSWRTCTAPGAFAGILALDSSSTRRIRASDTWFAFVTIAHVSPGALPASWTVGGVQTLDSVEARWGMCCTGRTWIDRAFFTEVAFFDDTAKVVDNGALLFDFFVQAIHYFYEHVQRFCYSCKWRSVTEYEINVDSRGADSNVSWIHLLLNKHLKIRNLFHYVWVLPGHMNALTIEPSGQPRVSYKFSIAQTSCNLYCYSHAIIMERYSNNEMKTDVSYFMERRITN